ncbi:hypothetical protein AOQ84DRAFT_441941 [Glonium stellatum]|uniref:DUF7053 domain-containing protein n=1 Tax=Glonium stellatum TaxID=574774 RepID=A0A8E2JPA9_9PEZI|nr:hypothetical protein AOQ84DRAFT_441941 [Glonium stellatum]
MSRSTHNLRVAAHIPDFLTTVDVIEALHNHDHCLTLQALTKGHQEIPTNDEAASDPYFSPEHIGKIKTYEVTEAITIIPGIGEWGRKYITFPVCFQNTPSGLKTRANAAGGVVLHAEYLVLPGGADSEVDGEGEGVGDAQWVLVEDITVECSWWLMPFVRSTMETAHRDIVRKVVEKVVYQHRSRISNQ